MLLPLRGFDEGALGEIVTEQYGERGARLEFIPAGEDSWAYRFGTLWVSVRRDLRGHVPLAYETAHQLWQSGNDSILAPLAGADGLIVRTVDGYPTLVLPYVDAAPIKPPLTDADMSDVIAVVERLHASRSTAELGREDFTLPFEDDIGASLNRAALGTPDAGPYGAPMRDLVRAHWDNLAELRAELKDLATTCAAVDDPPVLTHGEPHPGNILRLGDQLLLADWTELQWGPPERDWYHVISTIGSGPRCRPEFFRFYEIRWWLSEFAEYADRFLGPHRGDHEDATMWRRLVGYFPENI